MESVKNPEKTTEFHLPNIDSSKGSIIATYTPSKSIFTANVNNKASEEEQVVLVNAQEFAEKMRRYAIVTEETEDAMLEAHRAATIISSESDRSMVQTFQPSDKQRFSVMYLPEYEVYLVDMQILNEHGDIEKKIGLNDLGVDSVKELQRVIPVEIPKQIVRNLILDHKANIAFKKSRKPEIPGPYIMPGNEPNLDVVVFHNEETDTIAWLLAKDSEEVLQRSQENIVFSTVDELINEISPIAIITAAAENKMRKEIENYRSWNATIIPSADIMKEPEMETGYSR